MVDAYPLQFVAAFLVIGMSMGSAVAHHRSDHSEHVVSTFEECELQGDGSCLSPLKTGGQSPWQVVDATPFPLGDTCHSGAYCAGTGPLDPGEESVLNLSTGIAASYLQWSHLVTDEPGSLEIRITNKLNGETTTGGPWDETGWTTYHYLLDSNSEYLIEWIYRTPDTAGSSSEAALIDNVWMGATPLHVP